MNDVNYIRVAACSPMVKPCDIDYNIAQIEACFRECAEKGVALAVFPELSVTGYTCADLFQQDLLIEKAREALTVLARRVKDVGAALVVGVPVENQSRLYNCAAWIENGRIQGIVPKTHVPNYGEFYERRWFAPASEPHSPFLSFVDLDGMEYDVPFGRILFESGHATVGIEICEDLWVPNPPSSMMCMNGAKIILNLSASNELIGKHTYLKQLISGQSARCRCAYVYSSSGANESSSDLAFCGNAIIYEDGKLLAESDRFVFAPRTAVADIDVDALKHDRIHFNTFATNSEPHMDIKVRVNSLTPVENDDSLFAYRHINIHPFVDSDPDKLRERCDEISSIQAWGLAVRLNAIGCKHAVIGVSGGLDSTLAMLVTCKAFDMLGLPHENIQGITMPGFGTTERTHGNADKLMELLGVTKREIPIGDAVKLHFRDIGHSGTTHDVTYENSQARERTQILMDMANMLNGIVIGTGDLSELALGWCTYNGDHMSMYAVNASVPKTLVKYLVEGYASSSDNPALTAVLTDIVNTPISPELLPADKMDNIKQKTEDLVGPYELHDFFLYNMLRYGMSPKKIYLMACKGFKGIYSEATITHWLKTFYRRFFSQQFKRDCMPDGVKVGSICLSPRGDWRMPSDASRNLWLSQLE
ncbi:MAG: NAD(+) synthase [Candidatus Amulumruptor caecigallinarius]|nr:NAD(+) synthase [Candidatus Amulumruptor caecigallinarius]